MATSQQIAALANLVELLAQCFNEVNEALPEPEAEITCETLHMILRRARTRLVTYLASTGDMLVGTECCDAYGDVHGVVTKIEHTPYLMAVTTNGAFRLLELHEDNGYFRLPGSDAFDVTALVELARQRMATAPAAAA